MSSLKSYASEQKVGSVLEFSLHEESPDMGYDKNKTKQTLFLMTDTNMLHIHNLKDFICISPTIFFFLITEHQSLKYLFLEVRGTASIFGDA